jgi:coenzyme F420-0:L-glutamate ligase / coenzyme F420-1:gamma-L-glutamate ligase
MVMSEKVEIIPIRCSPRFQKFKLAETILDETTKAGVSLGNGDILVVSSKFASVSEGRFVDLSKVKVSKKGFGLAEKYRMSPALSQLVLNNSSSILGGVPGFVLALNRGVLAPNAGIDLSNAPSGWAVLYPKNPFLLARNLRSDIVRISKRKGAGLEKLGVIVSDSRVTPTRLGTVGMAIAVSGMRPTIDMRGKKDLFQNKLKVTIIALADQLASAAELCMGEAAESTPVVIIRGVKKTFQKAETVSERRMTISPEKCIVISGLRNRFN